jgi:hypothetical protein
MIGHTYRYHVAMTLDELRRALDELDRLSGLDRVRRARELSDHALAALAAVGDEGVWQATRTASRVEVASALGVSVPAVGKAVTRHNRRGR